MAGKAISPFDEAKYKALLEGLEISEILLKDLEFSKRLDAEYYKKLLLHYEQQIRQNSEYIKLSDDANFLIGPFGSSFDTSNYIDNGEYRYVRGQDVKPFQLKDQEIRYLPKDDYFRLEKYALKENDILISVVGTLGNACSVRKKDLPAIFSCKSTAIRTKNINSNYLVAFLNSKYGRGLLLRKERGAIQKGLNLEDLKTILVPSFSTLFQLQIDKLIREADILIENSKNKYLNAENLLLNEIGLKDFTPSKEAVNIKSFKESFSITKRLDAEYYQKKYDDIELVILNYKNGFSKLKNQIEYITTGEYAINYSLKNENLRPYIRNTNINNGIINTDDNYFVNPIDFRSKSKVDEILTSRVGTIGLFGVVKENQVDFVYSDNILCFKFIEGLLPDVYALLFSTKYYHQLLEKLSGGSVQPLITQTSLKELYIPLIKLKVQEKVAILLEESFKHKAESERLFDVSKKAVEMAIEADEDAAIRFIEENS